MDDRYYEDDEITPRENLDDDDERGDGAVDEPWVEEYDIEYPTPKKGIQCSYCNAVFSNYPDLFTHSKIHQEQKHLRFIWEHQPCPGRLVGSKFKNISLRRLEKQGKIIFSDKDNGWMVKGYEIESKNKIKLGNFDSLDGAPCLACLFEPECSVSNRVSPITCQWIKDWVLNPKSKNNSTIDYQNTKLLTVKEVKKFVIEQGDSRTKGEFVIEGMIHVVNTDHSGIPTREFMFIDKRNDVFPLIIDSDDQAILADGDKIKITGAKLSGSDDDLKLLCRTAKIQKL